MQLSETARAFGALAVEDHFHIFNHTAGENMIEFRSHPAMLGFMLACFPVVTMLGLLMIIPLGPYVTEHAAFQNLSVARPDHYLRLCTKVYKAWGTTGNGKLASKDL